jgi:hypothetical protein
MSTNPPLAFEEQNLSLAWGRALLHVIDNPEHALAPLTISVSGFENEQPLEDREIRQALDVYLASRDKKFVCKVSGLTIFPHDTWIRRGRPAVHDFSEWYLTKYFPRLQARDSHNNRGTYFERMIRYCGNRKCRDNELEFREVNQLEHIIDIWKRSREKGRSPRRSALQVSIFDPAKDHTGSALLGFPCLQQVSFSYDQFDCLAVNAFYPTQYIVDRAYGNYLGLCHLGAFMAREMGLSFSRVSCYIGQPELGNGVTKGELNSLAALVRSRFSKSDA